MKPEQEDGGPAFPTAEQRFPDGVLHTEATYGMTLRDYFAAKAMQGILASPTTDPTSDSLAIAKAAYEMADDMLKARES